ncbi:MAG TPA: DUF1080 domain-containing protein [Bryobacteraceae bacterium]|nr:DUF1080 domain-containing protein [Bryobacteraceae bacterium]
MRSVFLAACACLALFAAVDDQQFNGRWNIAAADAPRPRIWWLEVSGAGIANGQPKGRFLGTPIAQVEDVPRISILDGEMRFAVERKAGRDGKGAQKLLYYARLEDGRLKGTFEVEGDPSSYAEWTGIRAPNVTDHDDVTWKRGDPVVLFDGHDLGGWQGASGKPVSGWIVKDGSIENTPNAQNLVSDKKFWNFALHMEYLLAPRANSGVVLRGRYEVQLADDFDRAPSPLTSGAILGRIAPNMNAADFPQVWQSLDVRLVGRQVTVALNEITVINRQTIEGPTAIALDANEADPGPIMIQGDRGVIQIRKLVVYPLTKTR